MTPEPDTSTAPYLLMLIVFQLLKTGREWWRDKRRHRELVERMEAVEELAKNAADDSASANRKMWRLTNPGQTTPNPMTVHGVPIPKPRGE